MPGAQHPTLAASTPPRAPSTPRPARGTTQGSHSWSCLGYQAAPEKWLSGSQVAKEVLRPANANRPGVWASGEGGAARLLTPVPCLLPAVPVPDSAPHSLLQSPLLRAGGRRPRDF